MTEWFVVKRGCGVRHKETVINFLSNLNKKGIDSTVQQISR